MLKSAIQKMGKEGDGSESKFIESFIDKLHKSYQVVKDHDVSTNSKTIPEPLLENKDLITSI